MYYRTLLQHQSKLSTYYFIWIFLIIFAASFFQQIITGNDELVEQVEVQDYIDQVDEESNSLDIQEKIAQEIIAAKKTDQVKDFKGEFVINSGDTLAAIFEQAEINNSDSYKIISSIKDVFNPKNLKVGNTITIDFDENSQQSLIANKVTIRISPLKNIEILRNDLGEYTANLKLVPVEKFVMRRTTVVHNSFIGAASKLSIPHYSIMALVRAYSYDIDFQRDIKPGDKLDLLVERFYTNDGNYSHDGDVLYSSLTIKGKKLDIYKFVDSSGNQNFYHKDSQSITKTFLKTPINAVRISSKFGMRKHPVLGYSRMHKGIDFSAPTGTPIFAAGSGQIVEMGYKGGYGNYLKIKHNNSYSTAYGHISKFKNGIKKGVMVKQGQIIAYVGSTGLSSGPHLHYEVIENGRHINPLKVKSTSSCNKLAGKDLIKFNENIQKVNSLLNKLENGKEVKF